MDFNILYNRPIDDFVSNLPKRPGVGKYARSVNQLGQDGISFNQNIPTNIARGSTGSAGDTAPDYIGQALGSASRLTDLALPELEGLTPEEREEMTAKALEAERLRQPARRQSFGSFNPNNPFSLDTRGLSGAVSNAFADHREAKNHERLQELAPELAEMARRQERADQRDTERTNFKANTLVSEYNDARGNDRFERRLADQLEREDFVRGESDKFRSELQDKVHAQAKDLAEYRNKLAQNPDSLENRQIYVSAINNYIRLVTSEQAIIDQEMRHIYRLAQGNDGWMSPEDEARLQELKQEYDALSRRGLEAYQSMGVIPGFDGFNPASGGGRDTTSTTGGATETTGGTETPSPTGVDLLSYGVDQGNQTAPIGYNSTEEREQARTQIGDISESISSGDFTEEDISNLSSLLEREWKSRFSDNPEMMDNQEAMEAAIRKEIERLIPESTEEENETDGGGVSQASIMDNSVPVMVGDAISQGLDAWRRKIDQNREGTLQRRAENPVVALPPGSQRGI